MEKRALLAVVLSVVVMVLYQAFFLRTPERPNTVPTVEGPVDGKDTTQTTSDLQRSEAETKPTKPEDKVLVQPRGDSRSVMIETPFFVANLSSLGGVFSSFKLVQYRETIGDPSSMFDIIGTRKEVGPRLTIEMDGVHFDDSLVNYDLVNPKTVGSNKLKLSGKEEKTVTFVRGFKGKLIHKAFVFRGDDYRVGLQISVEGGFSERPVPIGLFWRAHADQQKKPIEQLAASLGGRVRFEPADGLAKLPELKGSVDWFALSDKHFLSALALTGQKGENLVTRTEGSWLDVGTAVHSKPIAGKATVQATMFLGPKEVERLKQLSVGLEKAVDFGWFWFVAMPLLQCLRLFHRVSRNYGIDIIVLTIAIKLAFVPLTQKSLTSMKEMQKLQPQMAKIREKFKSDKEKLNREMMELYKRHRVNPFGGCLPMLLQIPVFMGLYQALLNAVELRHARFALWVNDLSAPDRLVIAGTGIPVLTILMGASMLLQQWISPATGDPSQRVMMLILPVVFTFTFINFPSGLVLYWLVNNILSIGQQYYVTRAKS